MPALDFKGRFADMIERGQVTQTIRRQRKRPIKPGDKLYLFSGMKTKQCRRLKETRCGRITNIFISTNKTVLLDNRFLTDQEKQSLALRDGFNSFDDFLAFFRETSGLPLDGQLIEWV